MRSRAVSLARLVFALASLGAASRFRFRVKLAEFFHAVVVIGERLRKRAFGSGNGTSRGTLRLLR